MTVTADGQTDPPPVKVTQGLPVSFAATVTGCSGSYFYEVWDFGDGTNSGTPTDVSPCNGPVTAAHTYTTVTGNVTVTFGYVRIIWLRYQACQWAPFTCPSPPPWTDTGVVHISVKKGSAGGGLAAFAIQHDGNGIKCQAEPVTVTALNGGGAVLSSFTGTATLSTSTNHGDWTVLSGAGTLTPGGPDSGQAIYQFASADNGQVVLGLRDTHAEALTISATWPGVLSTSAVLTFRPYGFQVTPNPIGTQVSGRPFNLTLTAVGSPPSGTGCSPITEYSGVQNVRFWATYVDPASNPFGNLVSVNATAIGTSEVAATTVPVTFNNGVSNPVTLVYPDAGSIQVQMKDDINVGAPPAGTGSEVVIGGAAFVVRPFGFDVTVPGNPGAVDDTGPAFIRAGQAAGDTFDANLRAVAWQAADDVNNDGVPDGIGDADPTNNANLSDNPLTPNFGEETTPASISLSALHLNPRVADGGTAGVLNGAAPLTASGGTAATGSVLRYSEVGVIELDAAANNYLGGTSVQGGSGPIGRFFPDHFVVAGTPVLVNRSDVPGCTDSFTYMDEDFRTQFTLQAVNADGNPTQNYETLPGVYDYAYLKLAANPPAGAGQLGFAAVDDPAGTPTALTSRLREDSIAGTFSNGVASLDASLRILRSSGTDGPFANLAVGIKPVDKDGVSLAPGALDLDPTLSGGNTHEQVGSTDVRQGRVVFENAFGSQYLDLTVPLYTEYYAGAGAGFVANGSDNCTAIGTGLLDLSNNLQNPAPGVATIQVGSGSTTATIANNPMASGRSGLSLSRPNDSGYVDIDLDLSTLPWLQYDWDGNGVHDNNPPTARATFGSYRGDDRIIYWREVNQ
ncbi:MAG TPA: DUF6701 domain-containing protein [Gammaproteobacteria bacterium]|nr:DUF6701 domain-containing protein [Gammaproteobacteria bacterium]